MNKFTPEHTGLLFDRMMKLSRLLMRLGVRKADDGFSSMRWAHKMSGKPYPSWP